MFLSLMQRRRLNVRSLTHQAPVSPFIIFIEKQAERRRTEIDSEIQLLIKKTESDAHFYKITQTAEANKKLYSESYLRALLYKSLANNRKVFFGENLPSIYSDLFPKNSTLPFP
eukprot:TRINITY_DN647_c0_g1_i2.p1 TRINITY_DN647_c0_g1~~TRINITY_DN647_c0_g1_i2.p1  ORF type:complete len:114 (+),score=13.87 TRINITY_DN647_c0_g1_i2:258-599(+)